MCVGQVGDVDVVANAGSVGRGVVFAVNANGRSASEGHVQNQRDEVGFRLVGFTAGDAVWPLGRPSHVEIAQRGVVQAVNAVEPGEHMFNQQLGFAVSVGGLKARIFLNRHALRFTINRSGGGKDEPARSVGKHSFKEGEGGGGVIAEVDFGLDHGFAGFDESGEVEHPVEGTALILSGNKKIFNRRPV